MSNFHRLRRIGPFLVVGFGSVMCSYSLAIFADSRKKNDALFFRQNILKKSKNIPQLSNSNNVMENVHLFWNKSRESQKTMYSIILLNSAIFLGWRIPFFSIPLNQFFLHSISSHPLSMLGSIFSHKSFLHLSFNMLALNSFGNFLHEKMGREQFLAFYLSSGAMSSLASHIYKSFCWNFTPSLGASGAIFGIVGGCAHYPDIKVSLIFLPFHSIPISQALPVMTGIDLMGLLKKWRIFDHSAHLGGALFGYSFYPISQEYIWKNRKALNFNFR